ncbi:MAG TPA: PadR family transcriptional regulator [Candidatus Dormibacteraeota bacterium]|nr:PadR family transcriptional regulator [Candidatus Dormibacteraeota bacterium]
MARTRHPSPQTARLLLALAAAPNAWHYGYELSRATGLRSGTLYPILIRLARDGYLETRWLDPDRPGRPPRHVYRLTGTGRELARNALARPSTQPAVAR